MLGVDEDDQSEQAQLLATLGKTEVQNVFAALEIVHGQQATKEKRAAASPRRSQTTAKESRY